MSGYNVDPALLQAAKAAIDEGAGNFRDLAGEMSHQMSSLRGSGERPGVGAFAGGYGLEGHFQQQLATFGAAWLAMFSTFIADEYAFVTFLEGFSARLDGTHNLYQELESSNAKLFDDLSKTLDRGE